MTYKVEYVDWEDDITNHFHLQERYLKMFESYKERGVICAFDKADKEYTRKDDGGLGHYFAIGADALRIIVSSLLQCKREPPKTILDFPSGSGRITRHLKSFFPDAKITACDLYEHHVDFCVNELGVEGHISNEFFDQIHFEQKFDLIFCGSLLTHLPKEQIQQALELIVRSLSETGIAVVTLHGRHSIHVQDHKWKYIEDKLFSIAKEEYINKGFGYVDYDHDMRSSKFDKQARYGISLAHPSWVLSLLECNNEIRILGYFERHWDNHQDVVVFGKPGINADNQ